MYRLINLLAAAVAVLAVAATAPVVTEAVVAVDPCGDPLTTGEVVAPTRDLCDVTFRSTTVPDEAPRLDVAIRVAGDEVATDSIVEAYWDVEDCTYAVVHRPAQSPGVPGVVETEAEELTSLDVACGESRECVLYVFGEPVVRVNEVPATDCPGDPIVGTDELDVTLAGDTLTFHVRFEGVLGEFADHHGAGATLTQIGVEASPATTTAEQRAYELTLCAASCHDVSSDRATGTAPFEVG